MPTLNGNFEGFDLNLTGSEANRLFLKPTFVGENILTQNFSVLRGVKQKATMWFLNRPSKTLQLNSGCGWNASGSMDLTFRDIVVSRLKVNMEQCADEFFDTALEQLLGGELDIDKLDATQQGRQIIDAMIAMIQASVQDDAYLTAWLEGYDNEGATSVPTWYQKTTRAGLFQKIEDGIAAGEGIIQVDNGGSDYSGSAMTDTLAIGLLRGMVEGQPTVLRGIPNSAKRIDVSTDIYDKYTEYLEDLGTEEAHRVTVNGMQALSFRGIPVIEQPKWQDELTDTFSLTTPHRAVLSVGGNMHVATDITSQQNQFRVWFDDMKEEQWYYKAKFKLGFDYAHPELIVYAR